MQFLLGTHRPNWLERLDVPLFVSHRTLKPYKRLPVARCSWSLDSGGFTELSTYGEWRTTASEYVEAVGRYRAEVGRLEWAAPMDWMCEPFIVEKTGLSVREHQERTVSNYLRLRQTLRSEKPCPECEGFGTVDCPWCRNWPGGCDLCEGLGVRACRRCGGTGKVLASIFIPVLQGWTLDDYEACVGLYEDAGVDLTAEPVVGLGSVCRRQNTAEIGRIVQTLHGAGISCHGFGVKKDGLRRYGRFLASADSMAWSFSARRDWPLPGCTHRNCANCSRYALRWRGELLAYRNQGSLLDGCQDARPTNERRAS